MSDRLQVLWYSDTPNCATGFGAVARNILKRLYATGKYDFTCIGINHSGDFYDQQQYPYRIYPAVSPLIQNQRYNDPYGRQKFIDFAGTGQFDIVFMLQDTFIIESFLPKLLEARGNLPKDKQFPIVYYFPIDGIPKPTWITEVVSKVDFPVTYTQFAKKECLKYDPSLDLPIIYHGIDRTVFYPLRPDEIEGFRTKFFHKHKDKFIMLNVNRNQPRKDLMRTLKAFKIFHDKQPNSFLFLLCQAEDVGGNIIEIAKNIGLEWDVDFACPPPGTYGANQGYGLEVVNMLYNSVDLVISSTLGEGWGLSSVEAMATKTPILFPDNTSLREIIGENEERGYFCKSGTDENLYICLGAGDNNQLRPVVDVYDMAAKMEHIYSHRDEAKAKAGRAYREVWTWDLVCEEWVKMFDRAANTIIARKNGVVAGRNDPCPCNSGKKYKDCCGR